jgi:hypothetical protein
MTRVLPTRQKLLGLKDKSGKAATDDILFSDIKMKPGQKLMMMGTPEDVITATNAVHADGEGPEIVDDFQMKDDLFEELEPNKDPDVLVCCPPSALATMQEQSHQEPCQILTSLCVWTFQLCIVCSTSHVWQPP